MDRMNVKCFIDEFKDLMKVLNIDICHSELQDKWFVFRTNETYVTGYDFFFQVQDESDLAEILLSELSYDIHVSLGYDDVDTPECEKNNIGEIIDKYTKKKCLPEIAGLLDYIKNNITGTDSKLMNTLENLLCKIDE